MTETAVTGAPEDAHGDTLPSGPSDADLIASVRDGDTEAYGELYRRHVDSARRLARSLSHDGEADDLVSEAFAKVLVVLQRGGGPDTALRPYLLTALRRLHVDRVRSVARARPTGDLTPYDEGEAFQDTAVSGFESGAAARAFRSLPERWQLVLWHLEVEGQKPADIAPLLGISANSVSALAYRAREGLRQAFVTMHAQDADDERCAATRAQLGAFIRNDISKRDSAAVEQHLRECRECAAIYLELVEVNSDLRALIAPIILGAAAATYLSGVSIGGSTGLVATLTGFVGDNVAKSLAGVAAAGVVVAGCVVGFNLATGDEPRKVSAVEPSTSAAADPSSGASPADGGDGTQPGKPGKPDRPTGTTSSGSAPEGSQPTASTTDAPGPTRPTQQPSTQATQPGPEGPSTSPPPPSTDAITSSARGTGGLAWVVDIAVKGLAAGQRGTVTVTLDRPGATIHLDPRCDLVSLDRLTCRFTGPGSLQLLVTPLPGATTTLTSVLQPGADRTSVRLD
jgi:RNA polymerase sigma factor (sigma-70 family)